MRISERCGCTRGGRRCRGEPQVIVNLDSEELRKSFLAHLNRLGTLEQVERMQNATVREGPSGESTGVDVQMHRRRETSQEVQHAHTSTKIHGQMRDPHHGDDQPTDVLEWKCRERDRERLTQSPPSAHSSSTRGCRLGKGQLAVRPTLTGPPGRNWP